MQKKIESATEARLSVEELRGQRLELLPDRIELHRRRNGRRRRNRNGHGGLHYIGFSGGSSGGGLSVSGGSF
jgi:hypothetical protein